MARVRILRGQSLLDIALSYYGTAEGVNDLIRRNNYYGPNERLWSLEEMLETTVDGEPVTPQDIINLREIDPNFDIIEVQDGLRERRRVKTGQEASTGIGYDRMGDGAVIRGTGLTPSRSFGSGFSNSFG